MRAPDRRHPIHRTARGSAYSAVLATAAASRARRIIGRALDPGDAIFLHDAANAARGTVMRDKAPRVGPVDLHGSRHGAHRRLGIQMPEGTIRAVDGEGRHTAP